MYKKNSKLKIIICFFCILLVSLNGITAMSMNEKKQVQTQSFYNVIYVGGTGPGNYTTIQEAINNASSGDKVFVYNDSSPYTGKLIIEKSLILEGEDRNSTVIDGHGEKYVICIKAENVDITKFTLINGSVAGVFLTESHSINISHNWIKNNNIGIDNTWDSSDVTFFDNTIEDNDLYGIYIEEINNIYILKNKIRRNSNGVFITGSDFMVISDNHIQDQPFTGIEIQISFNITCFNNTVVNSRYGIFLNTNSYVNISGNTISGHENGLILLNINIFEVYGNQITGNIEGLDSLSPINGFITMNNFTYNNEGLELMMGSNVKTHYNNFINNTRSAFWVDYSFISHIQKYFFGGIYMNSGWYKNYWDDWDGMGYYWIDGMILTWPSLALVYHDARPQIDPYQIP